MSVVAMVLLIGGVFVITAYLIQEVGVMRFRTGYLEGRSDEITVLLENLPGSPEYMAMARAQMTERFGADVANQILAGLEDAIRHLKEE
jgi:hypothetical protein